MPNPLISAIITTFNRGNLLKKAVESILNQTYKNFELIVLDNDSTDNTEQIVKSFSDERIRYIKHQPLNIAQARNMGVKEAGGEYVGFLDDDDEWLPNKLKDQLRVYETLNFNGRLGLVYGGFLRVKNNKIIEYFIPKLRGDVLKKFLCDRDPLTGSASNPLLLKRATLDIGGYDEKLKCSEDWEFYLRLFRKYEANFTEKPVLKINTHAGARLGDRLRDALEADLSVFNNFQDILDQCPRGKGFLLQAIGGKYCRLGELARGRRWLERSIKTSPKNLIAFLQYIFSFFGSDFFSATHDFYKKIKNFRKF